MARRTISLPDSVDALIRDASLAGESYSATVARLVREGAKAGRGRKPPEFVGTGDGPKDLGRNAERYLRRILDQPSRRRATAR